LVEYILRPEQFFLIARMLIVFLGSASLVFVYMAAVKLFNKTIAVMAAVFTGFCFSLMQMSSLIKEDNLAFLALSVAFYFIALNFTSKRSGSVLFYILAGLFVGLSAAAKYTFALGFVFVAAGVFMNTKDTSKDFVYKALFLSFAAMISGFALGNPFIFSGWHDFLSGTSALKSYYYHPYTLSDNLSRILFFYKANLGSLFFYILPISVIFIFIKERKKAFLLYIYPACLLFLFAACSIESYYILPTVPFFAIGLSCAVYNFWGFIKNKNIFKTVIFISVFLIICTPLADAAKFKKIISAKDTRYMSGDWICSNVKSGSTIVAEGAVRGILIFTPMLIPDINALTREKEEIIASGGSARLLDMNIKLFSGSKSVKSFDIYKCKTINQSLIDQARPEYIILSGAFDDNQRGWISSNNIIAREEAKELISKKYVLIKKFEALPKLSYLFPMISIQDFNKIQKIKLKDTGKIVSGYDIFIYRKI